MPNLKQNIASTSEISELSKIDYIKHKNRWFLYGGIGSLIAGGLLIIYLFIDYYYLSFNFKKKSFSDFSNFIVAISSIFFTSSSIFFLIYNLIIQREALQIQHEDLQTSKEELQQNNITFKKQQESLSLQQAETTFFNLINFHRNLVADIIIQYPDRFFKNLKTELYETSLNFHSDIIRAKFMSVSDLHNCPYHYITTIKNINEIESFIKSVYEIAVFIETKLNNDNFYHNFLFNILSSDQKFIFGYILHFELLELKKTKISDKLYESAYIEDRDVYKISDGYFPEIMIQEPIQSEFFPLEDSSQYCHTLWLTNQFIEGEIKYMGYYCEIKGENYNWIENYNEILSNKLECDFVKKIVDKKYPVSILLGGTDIPAQPFEENLICKLHLLFNFNNKQYKIVHTIAFRVIFSGSTIDLHHSNYVDVIK